MTGPKESSPSAETPSSGGDPFADALALQLARIAKSDRVQHRISYESCVFLEQDYDRIETCVRTLEFRRDGHGYSIRCSIEGALNAMLGADDDAAYARLAGAYYGLAILYIESGVFSPGPSRLFIYLDGDDLRDGEKSVFAGEAGLHNVSATRRGHRYQREES